MTNEKRAALRDGLMTCAEAVGLRGLIDVTDNMVTTLLATENLSIGQSLVLGIFLTQAAEEAMAAAAQEETT